MRILFASLAAPGHAFPLVPLAVAAQARGHDVWFAVGEEVHEALEAAGLNAFRPADCFYEMYPEDLAPALERLRPDLVVHEWGVPGAAIAARDAGIRSIWHGFGRMYPGDIGLEPPQKVLDRPHVDICPPSMQDPAFLAAAERIPMRPATVTAGAVKTTDTPMVYLTLGTAFGTAQLLNTAIAGLAGLGANVVVATGRVPVAALDGYEDEANVEAAAWVDQGALLPRADLVVHHGGSGTTLGALAAGVPQLLLPQGADQFGNAEAVVRAGAGLRLMADELSAGAVADRARALLPREGNAFRAAAGLVAAEIRAMPGPDEVAAGLESLRL